MEVHALVVPPIGALDTVKRVNQASSFSQPKMGLHVLAVPLIGALDTVKRVNQVNSFSQPKMERLAPVGQRTLGRVFATLAEGALVEI